MNREPFPSLLTEANKQGYRIKRNMDMIIWYFTKRNK